MMAGISIEPIREGDYHELSLMVGALLDEIMVATFFSTCYKRCISAFILLNSVCG